MSLVVGSILLVLLILEAALATGAVEYQQEWAPEEVRVIEEGTGERFHPKYGWTKQANRDVLRRDTPAQPWTRYTYDSQGFRNNYDGNLDNHTNHIIVLGDSFTEGVLASNNATYPYLLDRWTPDQDVVNYGIGGYSTEQSLRIYLDRGNKTKHDTVIYTHYNGNDMIGNVQSNPKQPRFKIAETGAELSQEPQNVTVENKRVKTVQNEYLRQIIGVLQTRTHTYPFLEPKIRALLVKLGISEPTSTSFPTDEELQNQTTKTRHLLMELENEAERNDAELVIISIPTRGDVRPNHPHKFTPADAKRYGDVQRELLRKFAKSNNGVTYQPMKPTLKQEVAAGNRMYGIQDGHLDDAGYCATATEVYNHLGKINDTQSFSAGRSGSVNATYTTC